MSLQQVLAPQMQQSLQLLQAPTLELRQLIHQELQTNPTLEELTTDVVSIEAETETPDDRKEKEELDFKEEFEAGARKNSGGRPVSLSSNSWVRSISRRRRPGPWNANQWR